MQNFKIFVAKVVNTQVIDMLEVHNGDEVDAQELPYKTGFKIDKVINIITKIVGDDGQCTTADSEDGATDVVPVFIHECIA